MSLVKRTYVDGETVITAANLNDIQDEIIQNASDISTKGTYSKPSGGIPASDLASGVQTSLGKADTAYQKPSGGIPSTDLASAVQTSLGKADTALQSSDIDNTLTVSGKVADAKATGDEISDVKNTLRHNVLTEDTRDAILNCFSHVVWDNEQGQKYYTELYNALYDINRIMSIDAVFTQGNYTIYSNATLDSLKKLLVVTATYSDGSTSTIFGNAYALTGTLAAGTSTITVTVSGKTDTFSVTVTDFSIPIGYTRYDYIAPKANSRVQQQASKFIVLPNQPNMNVLSLDLRMALRLNPSSRAIIGIKDQSDWQKSYSVYADEQRTLYGCIRNDVWGGIHLESSSQENPISLNTPFVLSIDNPETSPYSIYVDDEYKISRYWSTYNTIRHGMFLFANPMYNASNIYLEVAASVGDIILRKTDGECVGYYVPAVYSGKIGLYDIVTETFYTASTESAVTIENSGCLYDVGNWT